MNFLIDAQLPKSLSDLLNSRGHNSINTLELPHRNLTTDAEIISIANIENRIVISKDSDFLEVDLLNNAPKKIIIVKTGNIKNTDLLSLFDNNLNKICSLLNENSLIEITTSEIITHGLI